MTTFTVKNGTVVIKLEKLPGGYQVVSTLNLTSGPFTGKTLRSYSKLYKRESSAQKDLVKWIGYQQAYCDKQK